MLQLHGRLFDQHTGSRAYIAGQACIIILIIVSIGFFSFSISCSVISRISVNSSQQCRWCSGGFASASDEQVLCLDAAEAYGRASARSGRTHRHVSHAARRSGHQLSRTIRSAAARSPGSHASQHVAATATGCTWRCQFKQVAGQA